MKSIEILAVGLRVLGIYVLIRFIESLKMIVSYWDENFEYISFNVAILFVFLMLAIMCIKFPYTVAKFISPKSKDDSPVFNGSATDLQVVGFSLMGVWVLTRAIPDLSFNILGLLAVQKYGVIDALTGSEYKIAFVTTLVELMIGFYLIFQSKGLSNLISKLRNYH